MDSRKPLLATGKLVEDYTPLFQYLDVATELGKPEAKEAILIRGADFEKVKEIAGTTRLTVAQLISGLTEYVKHRIDPEIATIALSRYLNHEVTAEYAVMFYTRLLSCWIIEASSTLNIIKLG